MDKKGVGVVLLVVFVGVIAGGVGFMPTLMHNIDVQENEPVDATVVETELDVRTDDDGDEEYNPVVTYEYEVGDETYRSTNTYPGQFTRWTSSQSSAQSVIDNHPAGSEITVHYRPGDPSKAYLTNDGWPGGWFVGMGYVLVAIGAGVWLIRKGFRRWRQRNLIKNTPTESVQSLSIGPSELKGTAVTGDREALEAPFSEEDCVVASYEIKEYDTSGDNSSWKTIEEDTEFTPFSVDDGTGTVLVQPHPETVYDLNPDDWTETYVDSSDHGPTPVRQFVSQHSDLDFPSDSSGKDNDRKYRQNLIRDGESVYIFGTVHPREDDIGVGASNEERLTVRKVDEDGALGEPMYMISDDKAKNLTQRRRFALWRAPIGGLLLVVALAITLGTFGPTLGLEVPVWL